MLSDPTFSDEKTSESEIQMKGESARVHEPLPTPPANLQQLMRSLIASESYLPREGRGRSTPS